jgi:hypothetical protein
MSQMIETRVQNAFAAPEPQRQDAQPADPAEQGLRSPRGIRWLLLAGALVTGVSVFRLVQSQWAVIPVPFQFLILVGGSLALFGLGMVTRRRLHLPYAGSALLFLFTGLVPVLSWGAAVLHLLDTPSGWLAYGAGVAALLGATRTVLKSVLGYKGLLYPAALGVLLAAQPVLPWLAASRPGWSGLIYTAAALGLGAVLHMGSRHANRFFFHCDRRDGLERPVHWVPFALLGLLYAGALMLLDPRSLFMALPVAVIGMVLAGTGEEYYAALVQSLGAAPASWPRRSVALCGVGFGLVAAAIPLALRDGSLRCLALVAAGAAFLCLRWGLRYQSAGAWAAGIAAALCAFQTSPALIRGLVAKAVPVAASVTGLQAGSPALIALGHLVFLAALVAAAALLRRIDLTEAAERLRRTHAVALALHAVAVTVLALMDPAGALVVLVPALALVAAGVAASRRVEVMPVVHFVFAALVLCGGRVLLGQPGLVTGPTLLLLGGVTLAVLAAGHFAEAGLARFLGAGADIAEVRRALVLPVAPVMVALAVYGLGALAGLQGAVELMLAGVLMAGMALRFEKTAGFAAGVVAVSLGAHAALYDAFGPSLWLALLSQAGFVLCRLAARREGTLLGRSARGLAVWHAALGGLWLVYALAGGRVTIEPLILPLAGLALLQDGLAVRRRDATTLGLGLLAAWLPVQVSGGLFRLETVSFVTALLGGLGTGSLALAVLIVAARRSGPQLQQRLSLDTDAWADLVLHPLGKLVRLQGVLTVVACLLFSGVDAAAVTAALVGLVCLARMELAGRSLRAAVPLRPSLLFLVQLAVLAAGGGRFLPEALLSHGFRVLPVLAVALLGWRTAADALGRRWSSEPWATAVEALLAIEYGIAFFVRPDLAVPAHLTLLAVALGWSALAFTAALRGRRVADVWAMQAWGGLAVLHAFTAGWLHFGSPASPYVLLAAGAGLYVLAAWWQRGKHELLAGPCRATGLVLPVAAGLMGLVRILDAAPADVWFPALAVFLVSLFYMVVGLREGRRVFPSLASAAFLAVALLEVTAQARLGAELYSLGPGIALLALAWMLRAELGPAWSRHLTAAGAACVYATPIVALSGSVSWGWLAALLVLTVAFGAASFVLRSRSLLTVSTAAMLTDLGFFVFRIGTAAPMVLWILGLGLGLTLMGAAAWLEHQREGVLQQIRVFGRELQAWS